MWEVLQSGGDVAGRSDLSIKGTGMGFVLGIGFVIEKKIEMGRILMYSGLVPPILQCSSVVHELKMRKASNH